MRYIDTGPSPRSLHRMEAWEKCPRKARHYLGNPGHSGGESSTSQILGTSVHAALAHYYENRKEPDPTLADPDTARIEAIQAEIHGGISESDTQKICESSAAFWEKWLDPFLKDEVVAVEHVLEHPDYTCKADLIVKRRNQVWIVDHKTTSRLGDMWNYDFQFTALAFIGAQLYPDSFAGIIRHNIAFSGGTFLMNWIEPHYVSEDQTQILRSHLAHWGAIKAVWKDRNMEEIPAVHRGSGSPQCAGCALFSDCHGGKSET